MSDVERAAEQAVKEAGHLLVHDEVYFHPYDDSDTWIVQECSHCDDVVVLYRRDTVYIARKASLESLAQLLTK